MLVPMSEAAFTAVAFVFGLVFGSFANVVIYRTPRKKELAGTISSPAGSYCPQCRARIRWYDNVPLASYVLLRGRCRACGAPISWRYPGVEFASGLLFALAASHFGFSVRFGVASWFLWVLLVLAAIDGAGVARDEYDNPLPEEADELPAIVHVLPDKIVLPSIGAAAAFAVVGAALRGTMHASPWLPLVVARWPGLWSLPLIQSALGFVLGGGFLLTLGLLWRGGMGGGDIKLAALMGLVLGPYVLLAVFIGAAAAASVSLTLIASGRRSRRDPVPFGPFLALGGAITLVAGSALIGLYLKAFGLA